MKNDVFQENVIGSIKYTSMEIFPTQNQCSEQFCFLGNYTMDVSTDGSEFLKLINKFNFPNMFRRDCSMK